MEQIPKKTQKTNQNKLLPSQCRINGISTHHIEHIAWCRSPVMNIISVEETFLHHKSPKASCLRQMERKQCWKRSHGKGLVQRCSQDLPQTLCQTGLPEKPLLRCVPCAFHLEMSVLGRADTWGASSSAASTLIKPFLCTWAVSFYASWCLVSSQVLR